MNSLNSLFKDPLFWLGTVKEIATIIVGIIFWEEPICRFLFFAQITATTCGIIIELKSRVNNNE